MRVHIFSFFWRACVCAHMCFYVFFRDAFGGACLRPGHCLPLGRPGGMPGGGAWRWRRWRWWWWCVLVRGGVAVARRWCGGGRGLVTLVFVFLWVSVYRWAHQKTPEEVGDPQTPKKGNNACMIADFHCCWAQRSQKRTGPLQMASL